MAGRLRLVADVERIFNSFEMKFKAFWRFWIKVAGNFAPAANSKAPQQKKEQKEQDL